MRAPALFVLWALGAARVAPAQVGTTTARTGVFFESYTFGSGLAFDRISELTIPVTVTQRFGGRVVVDLATAYASASVREPGGTSIDHSGIIDTDVRATVGVIPGRLILTLVGTLPTGASTVPDTTIPLFGATATDLLGFTTPNFGSGGGLTAGFASAFKLGANWAAGTGASYRYGASYTPVEGGTEMSPGGEVRLRFGVEGPFGEGGGGANKYFRGAFVYTTSAANDLGGGGAQQSVVGDRLLAYAALSLPLGRSSLQLYGWEMRRLRARNYDAPGAVPMPSGNVLALGGRLNRSLSPRVALTPLLEFRHELTAATGRMELLGYLVRTGTDLRYRLNERVTAVVQAQLAFGTINDEGQSVSLVGPRVGAFLEWGR
jgi:hypothetical protein